MLRIFRNSVAILAATAALGAPLAAQTTAEPAPAATTQAVETPAAAVPEALSALGIDNAKLDESRRGGQRAEGTFAGGAAYHAMLDDKGALRMIRVTDKAAELPADVATKLVPENVRSAPIFAEFTKLQGVGISERGLMVFGVDAADEQLRAAFTSDGTLSQFGRGEFKGPKKDDHGKHERKGKHDKHGKRDHDGKRDDAAKQLDDAAVTSILTDGGYTAVEGIKRDGPRVEANAVNPDGEAVTVTINPRGVIVRELAR